MAYNDRQDELGAPLADPNDFNFFDTSAQADAFTVLKQVEEEDDSTKSPARQKHEKEFDF